MSPSQQTLALIGRAARADREAIEQLFLLTYHELRSMASYRMANGAARSVKTR